MLSAADKRTLWATADKLRTNMDAAEYKHIVLGLIFLKYVSDAFTAHRENLKRRFADPGDEYFLSNQASMESELEERDYYTAENVFWVPEAARWEYLQENARQPNLGVLIDDALGAIEADNPRLKNLLDNRFARTQLPLDKLGELVDLVSTIGFGAGPDNQTAARDVFGEIYEYFLGQFAKAEGKKGVQFYLPESVVRVLVETLAPHSGRVYDPNCGAGGTFTQTVKFVESHQTQQHQARKEDIAIYGQESNYTTWKLVAMNLVIRGIDFNLGREAADTFLADQHPDLRADYIFAPVPFNMTDWWHAKLEGDIRWANFGTPPQGNANFAWLSHIVHHLAPTGRAGVVLANGSMSSNSGGEGEIRKRMLQGDVVECMVALPPQLFFNTQIPACLWFLTRDKSGGSGQTDRRGQTLFIDARGLGRLETRVFRVLDDEDIARIASTYHAWRGDNEPSPPAPLPQQGEGSSGGQSTPSPHKGAGRGEGQSTPSPQGGEGWGEGRSTPPPIGRAGRGEGQSTPPPIGRAGRAEGQSTPSPLGGEGWGEGKNPPTYQDIPGFCKSASLSEIEEHGFILTPGRYVGAEIVEDDDEAFEEKMSTLTAQLAEQFAQSDALEAEIKTQLAGLGYAI